MPILRLSTASAFLALATSFSPSFVPHHHGSTTTSRDSSTLAFLLASDKRSVMLHSTLSPLNNGAITSDDDASQRRGGISMTLTELSQHVGGREEARLIWDLYAIGIEPEDFFGDRIRLGYDDFETICSLLPSRGSLDRKALVSLAALYPGTARVEGGVASLNYISRGADGRTKILLRLSDKSIVEAIVTPEGKGSTLTVSSQVTVGNGVHYFPQNTDPKGKCRSLSSDEILSQMFFARKVCRLEALPPVTKVVFKGPGDAADNADAVRNAANIFAARGLFQTRAVDVTVSTRGQTPESFVQLTHNSPCHLVWQLNSPNDSYQKGVTSTQYSMKELQQGLIDALSTRPLTLRTVSLEITLMQGVNDSIEHADELATFATEVILSVPGCRLSVNVIPYMNVVGKRNLYGTPSRRSVDRFERHLLERNIEAQVSNARMSSFAQMRP